MPVAPQPRSVAPLVAAGFAILFLGAIGFFVLRGFSITSGGGGSKVTAPELRPPEATAGDAALLSAAGQDIQLIDKRDPTRVFARLLSERTDPVPGRRDTMRMERPQSWIYLRDGRTVHVRAELGQVYMPDRNTGPESGTLTGKVAVSLYDPRPDGARIDPALDKAAVVLRTESLTFDTTLGELSSPNRIAVTSETVDFSGTGLKLILNEIRERIELLEVKRGDTITLRPAKRDARARAAAHPSGARLAVAPPRVPHDDPAPQPVKPPPPPVESLYQTVFTDAIVITTGSRELKADRLALWTRLLDNRLPEGAIGSVLSMGAIAPRSAGGPAITRVAYQPEQPRAGGTPVRPAVQVASPDVVVMRWTGPCVVRPMDSAPPELKENHVALRATAEKSGQVVFGDTESGITGRCAALDYGATTRDIALTGVGPASVTVVSAGGLLETVRMELSLATGVGHTPGSGFLRRDDTSHISWTGQSDFVFRMEGDRLTGALQQAIFSGGVQAVERGSSLKGEFVRADFEPTETQPSSLARLHVEDAAGAVARSARGESLRARTVDVAFKPGAASDEPDPTGIAAEGGVRLESRGSVVTGERLDADLYRAEDGDVKVRAASVKGDARFTRDDGVAAGADEIRVLPDVQRADLFAAAPDGAHVSSRGTRIAGSALHLDGVARTIRAEGPWSFEHRDGRAPAAVESGVRASGTRGMEFDDRSGIAECRGDVVAVATPDDLSQDRLVASHVRLELSPLSDPGVARADAKLDDRRLLKAVATGSSFERADGANANIESTRYSPDPGPPSGRRRTRLLYVEGPRILADNTLGTLDIPTAGRLLIADHRPADPAPAPVAGVGPRGDTLFDWDGSLHMNRAEGTMQMSRHVRLTHRSQGADALNLVCEHLTAVIGDEAGGSDGSPAGTELKSAVATGAVYAASGKSGEAPQRELSADRVEYDAVKGVLDLIAPDDGSVTIFDVRRATPVSAARMIWDLARDEIRVIKPLPIVAPR